jgi:hypothetical protein
LASQLKLTPANEVRMSEYHQKLKEIEREKSEIKWPKNADELPVVSWEECECADLLLRAFDVHYSA